MRFIFAVLLVWTAAGLGAQGKPAQKGETLILENQTGVAFVELYLTEGGRISSDTLGEDWLKTLGIPQWEAGQRITIKTSSPPPWTVIGVEENGEEIWWATVNPVGSSTVSLRIFGGEPQTVILDY